MENYKPIVMPGPGPANMPAPMPAPMPVAAPAAISPMMGAQPMYPAPVNVHASYEEINIYAPKKHHHEHHGHHHGYHHGHGGGLWANAGAILVLYILLVIIIRGVFV